MTSKIILKKSSVVAKVPLTTDLEYGELALNYADGVLWYKNSSATIQRITPRIDTSNNIVPLTTNTQTLGTGSLLWNNVYATTFTGALSGNASTATSLSGGSLGTLPYQSAAGTTAMLAAGTSGYFLKANGTAAPSWAELSLVDLPDAWVKKSARVATTANITLSAPQTIDGIAVIAGDRVLVKDQTTASQNGIYVVAAAAWSRAADANTASKIAGAHVNVDIGTANGGLVFDSDFKSTDTLDTTALPWYRIVDTNYFTTVGNNFARLTNPSAITFPRINADNTVSTLDAATFRTAIGAGTSSTTGTVTSVGGTGTVSGLTLTGTVTTTGNLTLGGTLAVTASNFASQTANTFLSAPNGAAGVPTFRTIVAADIPTLNQNTTGNAATATSADQIDGIAFRNTGSNVAVNADTLDSNGITYYTSGVTNFSGNSLDGALYSQVWGAAWQHQIAGDYRSGQIALRGKNNGTWGSWRTVLDSTNYNTYSPTLTGTGASGSWGISVTGNASTVTNGVYTTGSYADPAWITSLAKSKVGLGSVENTALSTWAGTTNITTIGAATASSLVVTGDLTVNGTTTTINSTTLSVDDKNIELGSVTTPSNTTADGGGITLKGATDKTFNWVNATSAWSSSEHISTAAGKSLILNGGTSGSITITPTATAGTTTLTLPATTGTLITSGDTGTVTSTMIADGTIVNADINASAAIAVSKLASSTISGITLGNNLNTLTLGVSGTGLSGSTTYNGSATATFTVTSNATNANTVSTIVARDASGNFSAGTITAALTGAASSNVLKSGDTITGSLVINNDLTVSGKIAAVKNKINTVTTNLGAPTVEEMALFHGEFTNKFRFIPAFTQEESTDGTTWTTSTRATANQLADIMLGEGQGSAFNAIPAPALGGAGYYRLTWDQSQTGYVFLNALYIYCSTSGNTLTFAVERYHNTTGWETVVSNTASTWPGHVYIPHTQTAFNTAAGQYGKVRITFSFTSATAANAFQLYNIEWFGGYPAGKRNVESYDRLKNVTFPTAITGTQLISNIATGTAPLTVTSTTLVTNLNADLLDGLNSATANTVSTIVARDASGNFSAGTITATSINSTTLGINNTVGSNGFGLSLYGGPINGKPTYGVMFQQTATFGSYGSVTADWATYFTMNSTANRGWIFKSSESSDTSGNIASINTAGAAQFASTVTGTRLISNIATGTAPLTVTSTTLVTNLNADLLDGLNSASASTVSTVAARDAAGDINVRLIRQEYIDQASIAGGVVFRVNNSTDNYLRVCNDVAAIRTYLGAYASSNPSGYTTNTGTVTSVGGTGTVSGLTLTGTVTTTGNLTLGGTLAVTASNFASQTANTVLAAPNNAAGVPTFRVLSLEDLPDSWAKKSVRAGTTANITLSAPQTIDGIAVIAGDRVLVKDQTSQATNGIYIVAAGTWTRSLDADTISELAGACVNVDSGTVNGGTRFDTDLKSTDTLGTTAVTFYKVFDTKDAASTNTANTLVIRDASGNFAAGAITCTSVSATGNITAYSASDARLKENINDIESALEKVLAIGGKTYDWTDSYIEENGGIDDYFLKKQDFGVIAQDVQKVFPIAVRERENGQLAVDYVKLVALSFAAIKEQQANFKSQQDKIDRLEQLILKIGGDIK